MFLVPWAVVVLHPFRVHFSERLTALPHCWGSSLSENSAWALSHGHQYFGLWSKSPVKASRYRIRFRSSPVRVCGSQAPSMKNWRYQCAGGLTKFPSLVSECGRPNLPQSHHRIARCWIAAATSQISPLIERAKAQCQVLNIAGTIAVVGSKLGRPIILPKYRYRSVRKLTTIQ